MSRLTGVRGPFVLLFGQAVLGIGVGVLWWAVTRTPADWLVGEPVVTTASSYAIARDGTLSVLGALVGLVAGIVVLRTAGNRPLATYGAAVAGALAGSLIAAGTGSLLPPTAADDPAHVTVSAWGAALVWPLVVSLVVTVVTLVTSVRSWIDQPR